MAAVENLICPSHKILGSFKCPGKSPLPPPPSPHPTRLTYPSPILTPPGSAMSAPVKVSYTHDAMIDLIIARPAISNWELAAHFGYTAAWCSMIKSSDAFKARLQARRAEIVDPTLTASIEDRIRAVTERALEVVQEKLAKPADLIPDAIALRAAEFGAKSLGIGQGPAAPAQNPNHLQDLAKRLVDLQRHHARGLDNVQDVDARFIESQA